MKTLRRYTIPATLALLALTLSFSGVKTLLHAQGVSYPGTPIALTRGGFPAAGATVTVCTGVVTVTLANSPPCAPYATIYSDSGLTLPITQPGFKTDGLGNYPFFVASGGGAFTIVLTGNGFTGQSTVWVAPIIGTLPNLFSALQTFDAALALKEIAAPSGLANYEVLYGNTTLHRPCAKLNNGAEDCIVTDAATATLTNKTTTNLINNGTPSGTGLPTITVKTGSGAGNYTCSAGCSNVFIDVDSTNLAYTVTIPIGWKLTVTATGVLFQSTAVVGVGTGIFDSVLNAVIPASILVPIPATTTHLASFYSQAVIVGDGASHTVKLRYDTLNMADAANIANSTGTNIPSIIFRLEPAN